MTTHSDKPNDKKLYKQTLNCYQKKIYIIPLLKVKQLNTIGSYMPHFYVINLERSSDRWDEFIKCPVFSSELFTRINAIDGKLISEEEYVDFDIDLFRRYNGRHPNPGEYGCYSSHVKALRSFYSSSHNSAVILEDDIKIDEEQVSFCKYLDDTFVDQPKMIRLETNRKPAFETLLKAPNRVEIGQCWFGPTGGAAAYWINRPGVDRILQSMTPGYLPVDVWLERAWSHGVPTFITKPSVFPHPTPPYSEIGATRNDEKYRKFRALRRISTLCYRTKELILRLAYSFKVRRVSK